MSIRPVGLVLVMQRPVVTTGLYLEWQVIQSAGMEALMQLYQAAGFSKEVSRLAAASRRPSTNRMYNVRWLPFSNWATEKGFDPLDRTAAQIAAFLYELFDTRGLSRQTVKGYRSCASVISRTGRAADPVGPTAAQIATFLNELFDTNGLSPHTIKGYRSCLASVLSRTGRPG